MGERLTLDEVKREELALLLQLDKLCGELGLRYTLSGGTLLGAVRHKGFIPWDDDIDVSMPRPDFEALLGHFRAGGVGAALGCEEIPGSGGPQLLAKVVNPGISVTERYVDRPRHLWVDVIPIDALPENPASTERVYREAARLRRLFALGLADSGQGRTVAKRLLKRALVPLVRLLGLDRWAARRLQALCTEIPYGSTSYVGAISWGLYGAGERLPAAAFDGLAPMEFEGHLFRAMPCWDEYLTGIYGDYMTPPPEEDRHDHGLVAWRD